AETADRTVFGAGKQGMRAVLNQRPPVLCTELMQPVQWLREPPVMNDVQSSRVTSGSTLQFVWIRPHIPSYRLKDNAETAAAYNIQFEAGVIGRKQDRLMGLDAQQLQPVP